MWVKCWKVWCSGCRLGNLRNLVRGVLEGLWSCNAGRKSCTSGIGYGLIIGRGLSVCRSSLVCVLVPLLNGVARTSGCLGLPEYRWKGCAPIQVGRLFRRMLPR